MEGGREGGEREGGRVRVREGGRERELGMEGVRQGKGRERGIMEWRVGWRVGGMKGWIIMEWREDGRKSGMKKEGGWGKWEGSKELREGREGTRNGVDDGEMEGKSEEESDGERRVGETEGESKREMEEGRERKYYIFTLSHLGIDSTHPYRLSIRSCRSQIINFRERDILDNCIAVNSDNKTLRELWAIT